MKVASYPIGEGYKSQEKFVAELTEAAYRVALRYGLGDQWLNLQLELWRALSLTINKRTLQQQISIL